MPLSLPDTTRPLSEIRRPPKLHHLMARRGCKPVDAPDRMTLRVTGTEGLSKRDLRSPFRAERCGARQTEGSHWQSLKHLI